MDKELEQLLKEMTSELKDLVRHLKGSSKAAIEGTKSIKQETTARKMAIAALEKQRQDLKAQGKLTKELNQEIDDSIEALNKFQKSASAGVSMMGLVTKSLKFLKDAVVSVATAGIKTGLRFRTQPNKSVR